MKKAMLITIAACAAMLVSASAADVKETWDKECAKCHGPDGKGETKMGKKLDIKNFTDGKYQDSLKDDAMLKAIKDGVKDGDKTRMKGFGETLSNDEIKALVAYVRKFKK
jgi:mono/diheme cytochrome c family protein